MKLLFDANLSPKLVGRLAELFPGSAHVFDKGLAGFTSDEAIWEYARVNALVVVTADSDFLGLAKKRGAPPHVVRLENCNYKTARVEALLRRNAVRIAEMGHSERPVLIIAIVREVRKLRRRISDRNRSAFAPPRTCSRRSDGLRGNT